MLFNAKNDKSKTLLRTIQNDQNVLVKSPIWRHFFWAATLIFLEAISNFLSSSGYMGQYALKLMTLLLLSMVQ